MLTVDERQMYDSVASNVGVAGLRNGVTNFSRTAFEEIAAKLRL